MELGNKKREAEAREVLAESYYQEGNMGQNIGFGVGLLRISKKLGIRSWKHMRAIF